MSITPQTFSYLQERKIQGLASSIFTRLAADEMHEKGKLTKETREMLVAEAFKLADEFSTVAQRRFRKLEKPADG